jgi:Tfp pilus assembly protein PilF
MSRSAAAPEHKVPVPLFHTGRGRAVLKGDARLGMRGLVLALALGCMGGCMNAPMLPAQLVGGERTREARQTADVQVAMGRALEKQGDAPRALTAYQDALKHDPSRGDAALGAARLLDQQAKFAESEEYYRKAEAAEPGSAKVACNHGYSLYLQQRWADAEAALRQALARQPDLRQAHNTLGLVLARTGRADEALAEFRQAGVSEADARVNLAFALTLQESWPEARAQYEQALGADPSSTPAKRGLEELKTLMTRLEQPAVPGPDARRAAVDGAGRGPN